MVGNGLVQSTSQHFLLPLPGVARIIPVKYKRELILYLSLNLGIKYSWAGARIHFPRKSLFARKVGCCWGGFVAGGGFNAGGGVVVGGGFVAGGGVVGGVVVGGFILGGGFVAGAGSIIGLSSGNTFTEQPGVPKNLDRLGLIRLPIRSFNHTSCQHSFSVAGV